MKLNAGTVTAIAVAVIVGGLVANGYYSGEN